MRNGSVNGGYRASTAQVHFPDLSPRAVGEFLHPFHPPQCHTWNNKKVRVRWHDAQEVDQTTGNVQSGL